MGDGNTYYTLDAQAEGLLARHLDWWRRKGSLYAEVSAGPLGDLWLPLVDGTDAQVDMDLHPELLDVERAVGPQQPPGPLGTNGDLFLTAAPYGRVPWVEAILGTPIRATIKGGSMRTKAFIDNWAVWQERDTHRDKEWFELLERLTETLVARVNGRSAPVHTLQRGPCDLVEAVVGPELMSFSLYDHPDELRAFLDEATPTFVDTLMAQLERIPRLRGGYVNPFGIWAPGTVVRTQCDATAFLSAAQYRDWFLPYDIAICEQFDYTMIHLHSCSLHTVPVLLAQEHPHGIQVTLESEPSGPPLEEMLPVFAEVLQVKPLLVDGPLTDDELQRVWDELPAHGLAVRRRLQPW